MKRFWSGLLILALSAVMSAQTTTPAPKAKKKAKAATTTTADDIRELKQMMQQQQSQIQQLQQQIQERDATVQQLQQQVQQTQAAAQQAQQSAQQAESSSAQKGDVDQLKSDMKDVQTTLTNTAVQTQDEQKHVAGIEGVVNRFRWNGDIRVRGESFSSQDNPGCAPGSCEDRWRARVRVRLGVAGKLNEDFIAGLRVATGAITDPTSTNETLTNVFERKNFYLDQGYITFQPHYAKWLILNGGKWAYTWNRSSITFDPDLNPEGFSEKVNWDFKGSFLKNFNAQALQLLFNEVSKGVDGSATGGSFSAKLEVGDWWTIVPTYTILNWNGENAIVQNAFGQAAAPFAPNGFTNSTRPCAAATKTCFASGFLYSDLLWNNTFKTWSKRFPLYINAEYEQNLDAAPGQYDASFGVGPCNGFQCASPQDKAYAIVAGIGQQKDKGDWQFEYEWRRQEADSVISSFNESDQRAPTNTLQNRFAVTYKATKNTQLGYTYWIGRTLNTALQNAAKASGILPGEEEPYLHRMQFDVIYTF